MSCPEATRTAAPDCPHCGGSAVSGYGSFSLKDGTRRKRFRCRPCDRTFHRLTGTPLNYLKKRELWPRFLGGMVEGWSVRHTAGELGIHKGTAFNWRHRLLGALSCQPQPVLAGNVAAAEVFVPYSEKGSRKTSGPGARGVRRGRPFRRFIDGKASCVLLARAGEEHAVLTVSHGRPGPDALCAVLQPILAAKSTLWAAGEAPYAQACSRMGVHHQHPWAPAIPARDRLAHRITWTLLPWLKRFHGVATRYLEHYLAWYRLVRIPAAASPKAALITLLTETHTPRAALPAS